MTFRNVQITEKLSKVQLYKLKFACFLTSVPLLVTLVLFLQLLIFGQLNLYFMEGSGLVILPQVREAYFDQLIAEMLPLTIYLLGLIIASFIVSLLVMNWACSPFIRAKRMVDACIAGNKPVRPDVWSSEGSIVEGNIYKLMKCLDKNIPLSEMKLSPRKNPISIGFLIRFAIIYLVISVITGAVLGTLLSSVHSKIVNLALNLIHGHTISTHFFTAQEEVLSTGTLILFFLSLFIYVFIGFHVARYLNTMSMVFSTIIRENRFPVRLRHKDIYHELADSINQRLQQVGIIPK